MCLPGNDVGVSAGRALQRGVVGFSPGKEKKRESAEQMGVEHLFTGKEVAFVVSGVEAKAMSRWAKIY